MSMYEGILLPVDGREGTAEILHHASELAHWTDATIQLLFIADTTRGTPTSNHTTAGFRPRSTSNYAGQPNPIATN